MTEKILNSNPQDRHWEGRILKNLFVLGMLTKVFSKLFTQPFSNLLTQEFSDLQTYDDLFCSVKLIILFFFPLTVSSFDNTSFPSPSLLSLMLTHVSLQRVAFELWTTINQGLP